MFTMATLMFYRPQKLRTTHFMILALAANDFSFSLVNIFHHALFITIDLSTDFVHFSLKIGNLMYLKLLQRKQKIQ